MIAERKKEIQFMLAEGNIGQAIKRSMDFAKDYGPHPDFLREILQISKTYQQQQQTTAKKTFLPQVADSLFARLNAVLDEIAPYNCPEPQAPEFAEEKVIDLKDLEKTYGRKDKGFRLGPVHAQFRLGEITGLVGPNANGKTTLLKILAGVLHYDQGEVAYPHLELPKSRQRWSALRQAIAYVPQEIEVWKGSLRQHLHYAAATHGIHGKDNELAVEYIIHRLGLTPYIGKKWDELSGGYKLRFALAQALVWNPALLIIDEPLANLDVSAQIIILNDLKDLAYSDRHPICVVISSQHLHEIEAVADRLILLDEGTVTFSGMRKDFAAEREENTFEFTSDIGHAALLQRLKHLNYHRLDYNGFFFVLRAPRELSIQDFLNYCREHQLQLDYFRDISTSVKQYFV